MGLLTSHLSDEHRVIQQGLETLKRALQPPKPDESEVKNALRVIRALRTISKDLHHEKEERILFAALDDLNLPLPGGPHCTQHMGQLLEWDYVGAVARASPASPQTDSSSALPSELQEMVARNPFLGIPISEHQAAGQALTLIEEALSEGSFERIPLLSNIYFSLMDFHIRKEDDCLFQMADALLPDEAQGKLLERALTLESRIGEGKIQEAKAVLAAR